MLVNKEKPCSEIFGLAWENSVSGVWNVRGTCIPMKVRILTNGLFTYSVGADEEVGEYLTMSEACTAAMLRMLGRLEDQMDLLRNSLRLVE